MKKTPVSILQEMMMKKGEITNYELIFNGGGSHQNVFTFQVSCDGLKASGTGRSKKDAKHEAATAMLEAIAKQNALPQLPASPCEPSDILSSSELIPARSKSPINVPFRNTIGELQVLCSSNNLDNPLYKETGNIGPAHAKVFTIQCIVSTFIEEGIDSTKRRAKHEAARKMLNRILGVVSDTEINDVYQKSKEEIQTRIAMARYPELKAAQGDIKYKVNRGIKVINYCNSFKETFDEEGRNNFLVKLEELNSLAVDLESYFCQDIYTNLKQEFENLLKSIEIQFSYKIYSSLNISDEFCFIIGITLNTAPDIQEIGAGKTDAEAIADAIRKHINSMKLLLT